MRTVKLFGFKMKTH